MDSIFVGQNDACWRIAGFEDMCSFSEIAKEVCGLCNTREEKFGLELSRLQNSRMKCQGKC
jgi:hypothetical protein